MGKIPLFATDTLRASRKTGPQRMSPPRRRLLTAEGDASAGQTVEIDMAGRSSLALSLTCGDKVDRITRAVATGSVCATRGTVDGEAVWWLVAEAIPTQ